VTDENQEWEGLRLRGNELRTWYTDMTRITNVRRDIQSESLGGCSSLLQGRGNIVAARPTTGPYALITAVLCLFMLRSATVITFTRGQR